MSTVIWRRPPRLAGPRLPGGELPLEPPPEPAKPVPTPLAQRLMPAVMVLASVGFIFVMDARNTTSWVFGGMFAVTGMGYMIGMGRGGTQRGETDEKRRDFMRYLQQVRRRVRQVSVAQHAALVWKQPNPRALFEVVLHRDRMWERRETDPDFGQIRVGQGRQRLASRLVAPQTGPIDDLEPYCMMALRRLIKAQSLVPDLPIAIALGTLPRVCLRPAGPPTPRIPPHTGPQAHSPTGSAPPAGSVTGEAASGPEPGWPDRPIGLEEFPDQPHGLDQDPRAACRRLAFAMIAQWATWHSPSEARLAVIHAPKLTDVWDWVKWLPHAQHPTLTDALGELRMATADPTVLTAWLDAAAHLLTATGNQPRTLVIVDGVDVRRGGAQWLDRPEITVLRIDGPATTERGELTLYVDTDRLGITVEHRPGAPTTTAMSTSPAGGLRWIGRPDSLTLAEATALARRMARYRAPLAGEPDNDRPLRNTIGLPELLGIKHPTDIAVARGRWQSAPRNTLRVPIGIGETGQPVLLDLKESAHGGHGPHGLCIGATGSGKSELLRTLLLGLAATHPSDELNMVLVDFKGGATFLGMAKLPHVSAVITNLARELSLVDRMTDALEGEINRRQEALRAAGNLASVADYEHRRRAGTELAPLPALLIVIDEFSEMLDQRPELLELMITIGRLGRSLQMHLLLASQRLDEGRLRGLESHLSYRIALRTFSPAESRAVIGVPDAYELPPIPGSGYLALASSDNLARFRAAYVSAPPPRRITPARTPLHGPRRPRKFTAHSVAAESQRADEQATELIGSPIGDHTRATAKAAGGGHSIGIIGAARGGEGTEVLPAAIPEIPGIPGTPFNDDTTHSVADARSVLDIMVDAMQGHGLPAHRVWLPPLHDPPPLDTLLPPLGRSGPRGLGTKAGGRLRVPVGLIDRPYHQRWDPLQVDLSGPAGHAVVVGAPQSGKSTTLATLLLGLALTNTPRELSIYALDFGGGTLHTLAGLPHVGGVADRHQPDHVRRTIAEIIRLLADRERTFRAAGISSTAEYRRRRAAGEFADDPHGDVILVVDGYLTLRTDYDDLEAQLAPLAARGLSYGVHLLLSASRWTELRPALKDPIGTRLELRLGDPADSDIDRKLAAKVPAKPGRGLAIDGGHCVIARPELSHLDGGLAPAVAQIAKAWTGPKAPPVPLLPERLPYRELVMLTATGRSTGPNTVPIGVDEARLEPVYLDFHDEPHLLCFADSESGKTNLLRVLAEGITTRLTPEQARIVLIDYRRTLLGQVPDSHLIGYASGADTATQILNEVVESLHHRLPGPTITPNQLRERSWWSGPQAYILVDDYDLVAPTTPTNPTANPLLPLIDLLPQAKDLGLHLILARRSGGAARALFEPVLSRMRESGTPALTMSGNPEEGPLLYGVKPEPLPPGRATLSTRRAQRPQRIQIALQEPQY